MIEELLFIKIKYYRDILIQYASFVDVNRFRVSIQSLKMVIHFVNIFE